MIEICKKLEWLGPYLKIASRHIRQIDRLERVGAWTIGKSRGKGEFAALLQRTKKDPFRIWIHTHYTNHEDKRKPFSKIDILRHFAHELAHLELAASVNCWDHTPKHLKIESFLIIKFTKELERTGYRSEEKEFQDDPK